MIRYLRWAFWSVCYLFRRTPRNLHDWLQRSIRTRKPWWKFKPTAYHNHDGQQWDVWFEDEEYVCVGSQHLRAQVHIGQESGRVVGLVIYDSTLKALEGINDR